jgi:hypothetical protein
MLDSVHEIAHASWEGLGGDISAVGRIERHRARLRAALDASDVSLPKCERVAAGAGAVDSSYADALAELEGAIARENAHVARASIDA